MEGRRALLCAMLLFLSMETSLAGMSRARALQSLVPRSLEEDTDQEEGPDTNKDHDNDDNHADDEGGDGGDSDDATVKNPKVFVREDESEFSEPNDDAKNPTPPVFREDRVSPTAASARRAIANTRRQIAYLWEPGDHITPRKTAKGSVLYLLLVTLLASLIVLLMNVVWWDGIWFGGDVENARTLRFWKVSNLVAQIVCLILLIGPQLYLNILALRMSKQYVHDSTVTLSTALGYLRKYLPYSMRYTLTLERLLLAMVSKSNDVQKERYRPASFSEWLTAGQNEKPDTLLLLILFFHPESIRVKRPPPLPLPGPMEGQKGRTRLLHQLYEFRINCYKWTKLSHKARLVVNGKTVRFGERMLAPDEYNALMAETEADISRQTEELLEALKPCVDNWKKEEAAFQTDIDDPVLTLLGRLGSWGGFLLSIAYLVPNLIAYTQRATLGCPDPNDENGLFRQRERSHVYAFTSRITFPYSPHALRWLRTGGSASLQCEAGYSARHGSTACTDYGGLGAGWSHLTASFSTFPSCCVSGAEAFTLSNVNASKLADTNQFEVKWKAADGFFYGCGVDQAMAAQVCDLPSTVPAYKAGTFCTHACKGVTSITTETPQCRYRAMNPIVDKDKWVHQATAELHPSKWQEERYDKIVQSVEAGTRVGLIPGDLTTPYMRMLLLNGLEERTDGPWIKI